MENNVYVKEDESALINTCGQFVYEVSMFVNYEGIYSLANHTYYYSDKYIKNIIKIKQISKYIEIHCDLFSAPEKWLNENNFILQESKKLKKIKNESKKSSN